VFISNNESGDLTLFAKAEVSGTATEDTISKTVQHYYADRNEKDPGNVIISEKFFRVFLS